MGVSYAEMMKSNKFEKLSTYVNILSHYVLVEDGARMCSPLTLSHIVCYRNTRGGGWSRDGCELKSSNISHTVCTCKHMTAFAVLSDLNLQVRPQWLVRTD